PEVDARTLRTSVVLLDAYGNAALAGAARDLEQATGRLRQGDRLTVEWRTAAGEGRRSGRAWAGTVADVEPGRAGVHAGSLGRLAIAVNRGSAASVLDLGVRASVEIRRAA